MPGLVTSMDPHQHGNRDEDDDALEEAGGEEYNEATYKPRPQLPKPFVCMRNLADLIRDLDSGLIDVDPEYQREVVWTAERMTGLINSLMENYYIPPIILNKKVAAAQSRDSKEAVHVCVDGKQRLSSVRAFVKGMVPAHDHLGVKWWFCDASNRRRNVLSEDSQRTFLSKEFVSFEFKDLSPEQEEDLFARVQMGVQLSAAEKMRASSGPWQELARLFVEDFPNVYSLIKDCSRAKDFQLTLSCFSQVVEVMHPTASDGIPILKTSSHALPKLLSNKDALDDGLKSHFASVWNTFKDLIAHDDDTFTNATKYLRGVQTFAPMEMVAVTVLISMYSKTRNTQLLLGDIRALRETIRENHVDIRMNAILWKSVWDFLENLEAIRGAVDGSTVNRRTEQPSASIPFSGEKRKASKRIRQPDILPPQPSQQPFVVKKEESTPMSLTESHQSKRQRIEADPMRPPGPAIEQLNGTSTPTKSPEPRIDPPNLYPVLKQPQLQYSPIPTHASTPIAQISTAPIAQTSTAPIARMPTQAWVPLVPRAHVLPSDSLMHSQFATSSAYSPLSDRHQRLPKKATSTSRAGLGPYSPKHTAQQWAGEVRSTTPPQSKPVKPSSKRKSLPKPRKAPQRPTAVQANEAIDLTGESEEERQTEQERRGLLSSFRARALAARKHHHDANIDQQSDPGLEGGTRFEEIDRALQNVLNRPSLGQQQVPTRDNKPYARFKQGASDTSIVLP